MNRLGVTFGVTIGLMAGALRAQEKTPLSIAAAELPFEVVIRQVGEMRDISDSLRLDITFTNNSGQAIVVLDIRLRIPGDFIAPPRLEQLKPPDGDAIELDDGGREFKSFLVPRVAFTEALPLLLFQHRSYEAALEFQYEIASQNKYGRILKPIPLKPLGIWWAAAAGGLLGVLFNILFRIAWSRYRDCDLPPRPLATAVLGCMAVPIVVWMFRFTSTEAPTLPILVDVKDFYGGGVIGLFFEPLASWIAGLLGVAAQSVDGKKPPSTTTDATPQDVPPVQQGVPPE